MKAQKKEFCQGQAVAVNTYNTIMVNAFWLIKMDTKPQDFKGSIFDDCIALFNDKTEDKTELANEINGEIVDAYQGEQGVYAREDLKEVKTKYSYEWLANINNKAIETIRAFSKVDFSIC